MFEQQQRKPTLIVKIVVLLAVGAGIGLGTCGIAAVVGDRGLAFLLLGGYLFCACLLGLVLIGAAFLLIKVIDLFFNT